MNVSRPLEGVRVLVVEDEFLIALSVAELLEAEGATIVAMLSHADEAREYVVHSAGTFDLALLDVNLHGARSYGVADALVERGIGFVFTTGYGVDTIDPAYRHFPRCEKPVDAAGLVTAMVKRL